MKNTLSNKILIVDDDPNILLSLEFLLSKNNYQVFIARNGLEALSAIEQEVPDIVLLDVMMPDLDGYEVCEFIRKKKTYAHAKVIFISARSKESDIEKGYEMGADLYVVKPFSTRTLLEKITELAGAV
ncbi:MAG: response regulator transcription factor [Sphingobacteriaceae bacterium]